VNRHLAIGVASVAGITLLGGCDDPGTAPTRTPGPDTTTVSPKMPRVRLTAFGVSHLEMAQRGDTTPIRPSVRVIDDRNHAVDNVVVNFTIVSGSGALENAQATSAMNGVAAAGPWRLGPALQHNVVRATSPSSSDTVYFNVEGVDVDSSRAGGRFVLDRIYGMPLPTLIPHGLGGSSFQLLSATVEIQGTRFTLWWSQRPSAGSSAVTVISTGSVRSWGRYLMLLIDGTDATDYFAESPAMIVSDGRLRIDHFAWDWQFFGNYWDFKRVP